jgi:hypothetical protein
MIPVNEKIFGIFASNIKKILDEDKTDVKDLFIRDRK